jgi:hypothetical protein
MKSSLSTLEKEAVRAMRATFLEPVRLPRPLSERRSGEAALHDDIES